MSRNARIEEIATNLHSMKRAMLFSATTQSEMPITPSQWLVLRALSHDGAHTVKDISTHLHISSSAATQLIDGLVKVGCVTREVGEKDKREVSLKLSQKCAEQMSRMRNEHMQRMEKLFTTLTEKELEQFAELTKKIVNSLS